MQEFQSYTLRSTRYFTEKQYTL